MSTVRAQIVGTPVGRPSVGIFPRSIVCRCVNISPQAKDAARNDAEHDAPLQPLHLNSTAAPLLLFAFGNPLQDFLEPQAAYFSTLGLPEWLIHWGHPGNMLVVLFAMGGYGALYQGWQIRLAKDVKVKQAAMDSHPKLAGGMAIFFALGALGGMTSLLMQGKNIFESPHATTGLIGLLLLGFQAMLPLLFKDDPSVRGIHAYLGTSLMALFLVHAALGIQLGLSI